MKEFLTLSKLKAGDQVGVVSPSTGLPGKFPWIQDLGLKRLRENFGLEPKEYPTTRQMGSSLENRARDIMAAFTDPDNKAVFASIGGNDQIRLIHLLDPQIFLDNPKPFFGFSDNTHLHNVLWNLGIPSYYGGAIMTQFAMQRAMHTLTVTSLTRALFESGQFELEVSNEYNDIGLSWEDRNNLAKSRTMEPNEGLYWNGNADAAGILWGGCVESLVAQVAAQRYLPKDDDLNGTILILETSETLPQHWVLRYLLTGFGERGWLDKFQAILVGRPQAWNFHRQHSTEEKAMYRTKQREAMIETVRHYNKYIPIVQNLDFGHTDPQACMPLGRTAYVQSTKKNILLQY